MPRTRPSQGTILTIMNLYVTALLLQADRLYKLFQEPFVKTKTH